VLIGLRFFRSYNAFYVLGRAGDVALCGFGVHVTNGWDWLRGEKSEGLG
jgi:hypothetical protein